MPTELVNGLGIMVVGMTAVFAFLTIMVLVMNLAGIAIQHLGKHLADETPAKKTGQSAQCREMEIAAVIAVARAQMQG